MVLFPYDSTEFKSFGEHHMGKVPLSWHTKSVRYQHNWPLWTLIIWVGGRSLHCKVPPAAFLYYNLGRRSYAQLTLTEWEVMLYLLEGRVSTWIIWNSATHISLFSPIYLFNHLIISVWTCGYLFYILVYNPGLLNIFTQIVPALANGSSFQWHLYPIDITNVIDFFSTSLLFGPRSSRLFFLISYSSLEWAISPRSPGFCYKNRNLLCSNIYSKYICSKYIYTVIYGYTHITIYFCMSYASVSILS